MYDDDFDEDEAPEPLPTYTVPDAIQFVEDMEAAGLTVEHYEGRFFWTGPAVRVDELYEAMSKTQVPTQYDNMGMGYIVYPKASDAGKSA